MTVAQQKSHGRAQDKVFLLFYRFAAACQRHYKRHNMLAVFSSAFFARACRFNVHLFSQQASEAFYFLWLWFGGTRQIDFEQYCYYNYSLTFDEYLFCDIPLKELTLFPITNAVWQGNQTLSFRVVSGTSVVSGEDG
jgi:hypothetical protein